MKKNDKTDLAEWLSAYLDGELAVEEAQEVERHLAENAEARQLFQQLEQVAQMVGHLPQMSAPEELQEDIQSELERDLLLGTGEGLPQGAQSTGGHERTWLAAAAMIALAGTAALVVYTMQLGPGPMIEKPRQEVAVNDSAEDQAGAVAGAGAAAEDALVATADPEAAEEVATLEDPEPTTDQTESSYPVVHLVVHWQAPLAGGDLPEAWFADAAIEVEQREPADADGQDPRYGFVCSLAQLKGLYEQIGGQTGQWIDVEVHDEATGHRLVVPKATQEQLLAVAGAVDQAQGLIWAKDWSHIEYDDQDQVVAITVDGQAYVSPVADPDWFEGAFAAIRPDLDNLISLGPGGSTPADGQNEDPNVISAMATSAMVANSPTAGVAPDDPDQMVSVVLTYKGAMSPPSPAPKPAPVPEPQPEDSADPPVDTDQ